MTVPVDTGLLYPALRKIGVTLGPGRTPSPAQYQDAIDELNRLTGSLNLDRLMIWSRTIVTTVLTGAATVTIGPGGDIPAPRPNGIEAANIISGTIRYPLAILTDLQWADIELQHLPNSIPEALYNDRAVPVSKLYLYGQPIGGQQLELYCWAQVDRFVAPTDVVDLPPGYDDAYVLNLAVRLAPNFQRPVDQNLRIDARESLMRIQSINAPRPVASLQGLGCECSDFDIYSGE